MLTLAEQRRRLSEALVPSLGGVYDCLRVWSAWSYGTMGVDDFVPVVEQDDRLNELVDAAMSAWDELTFAAEEDTLVDCLNEALAQAIGEAYAWDGETLEPHAFTGVIDSNQWDDVLGAVLPVALAWRRAHEIEAAVDEQPPASLSEEAPRVRRLRL